ncbi:MAG: glutathione S-transferase [Rhodobacterales bacterium CG2_30_65_12]|nr:MAG: glutathione S-transferase [Rhodobacterales bacterium CG2_30_65_12]
MMRLHYAPDNASLIVRLALDELRLPFETVLVDRRRAAQRLPAFRALNPRGLIPVLETPHGPMFETAAILLWLADITGKLAPQPQDPARGAFLSWLFAVSNGLHADLRGLFYPEAIAGPDPAAFTAHTRARIADMLTMLDTLAGQGHGWFAAAAPSILDLYIAVILRWLALYPVGGTGWFRLVDWPRLAALAVRIEARPSVARAQAAEGLGPTPFSAPRYPVPAEGSAT